MENIGLRYRNNSDRVNFALSDDPIARALEVSHQKAAFSFKTQTNDPTIPSNYTLHNQGKTLRFIGVKHVDNLMRMIQANPESIEFVDDCNRRANFTLRNVRDAILNASKATTSIIIEGMPQLDPDQGKPDFIFDGLFKIYPGMDWANPNIEKFLSYGNASEIHFAVLMAHHYGMRVISSESLAKQISALCKGKPESYIAHAFIFYACRDLIRFRGTGNVDQQAINALRGVINQVEYLKKIPEFQSLTMDSIQKIAIEIWGEQALSTQTMAEEMAHLITPYPLQYIQKLDVLSPQKKMQIKLFNQISQDLTKIRNRAIIDLAVHEFKSYKTVIPIFGAGHAQSCYKGFVHVMGGTGKGSYFNELI